MQKMICDLACVPMRKEPSDKSEMINQVLFGETMLLMAENEKWLMVRLDHDGYEGWIDRKQLSVYTGELKLPRVSTMFFAAKNENGTLQFLPSGSLLWNQQGLNFNCGNKKMELMDQTAIAVDSLDLMRAGLMFHGSPYLWGGRTMFGMDCSGFTQLVFRLCGMWIPRDSVQQAECGEAVSFIDETRTGDLAFFDNPEGKITHVGIVLFNEKNNERSILHCSGQVRIDKLDSYGIFRHENAGYSHNLRLFRRISAGTCNSPY